MTHARSRRQPDRQYETEEGLRIDAQLETTVYEKGRKVTDQQLQHLGLERLEFHGEGNHIIHP